MDAHREGKRWLTALLVVALLVAATCLISGVVFQTNDDNNIATAASGGVTGNCYAGNGLTGYPYGALLAWLYSSCPGLPWHGLLLMAAQVLSLIAVLRSLLFLCDQKKLSGLWGILAFAALYAGVGVKFMTHLQFTATPGYCAGALAALLWTLPQSKRWRIFGCALGFLLMAFGLLLRVKGGLLALPVPLMAGAVKLCKKGEGKRAVLFTCVATVLFACVLIPINDWLYEKNEPGWDEYARFDRYSATLLDYHNNDETYRLALEVTDWSPELIKCVRNWSLFLDERFNADNLEALDNALEQSAAAPSLLTLAYKTGSVLRRYQEFGLNALAFAILGLVLFIVLLHRRQYWDALLLMALGGSLLAVIAYFYGYLDRLPDRVAFAYAWPVYVAMLLVFLTALPNVRRAAPAGVALLTLAGVLTLCLTWSDTLVLPRQSESRAVRARLTAEVNAYAAKDAAHLYVTDVTQAYYAFSTEKPPINLLEWGNSMTNSPMYRQKLEKLGYSEGFTSRNLADENVRILFADASSLTLLLDCLNADLGSYQAVKETEQGSFSVYRLEPSAP